jgi:hypothetical protein
VIADEAALRALIGHPTALVASKVVDRLTPATRRFVEAAPLVVLATSDAQGGCDASPRGDPAGFVRILDDRTLLVPERPGNRIADSLRNLLQNPHCALLFVIPGVDDTFRVDGRDVDQRSGPARAERGRGQGPAARVLIDIEHAYPQCSKALLRSRLWDPSGFVDRATLPTSGEVMASILAEFDAEGYDRERAGRYARREGFY